MTHSDEPDALPSIPVLINRRPLNGTRLKKRASFMVDRSISAPAEVNVIKKRASFMHTSTLEPNHDTGTYTSPLAQRILSPPRTVEVGCQSSEDYDLMQERLVQCETRLSEAAEQLLIKDQELEMFRTQLSLLTLDTKTEVACLAQEKEAFECASRRADLLERSLLEL